jgi:uncharacterized protein (TIGR00730 family)
MVKSICVFCGARNGHDPAYREAALHFGEQAGEAGLEVVYGGGDVGLMGILADAVMEKGGRVVGFIPSALLEREVGHRGITDLVITRGMFDRKDRMIAQADAFVILPGGLGTLDEIFEVLTLRQLGYHDKPIVLVNVRGFFDPFVALVEHVIREGFATPGCGELYRTVDAVSEVLPVLGVGAPTTVTG